MTTFFFFGTRVLGLLICPKIAEAKIMIKHFAFFNTPQCKQTKKENLCRKKIVLYMGRNNINSKLTDKG